MNSTEDDKSQRCRRESDSLFQLGLSKRMKETPVCLSPLCTLHHTLAACVRLQLSAVNNIYTWILPLVMLSNNLPRLLVQPHWGHIKSFKVRFNLISSCNVCRTTILIDAINANATANTWNHSTEIVNLGERTVLLEQTAQFLCLEPKEEESTSVISDMPRGKMCFSFRLQDSWRKAQ